MRKFLVLRISNVALLIAILALFSGVASIAQNLTVPQIMAEPSIAGMRVEGEKLSPDGKSVVFLWNAEGKLPRDLYLSSTERADAKIILRVSDLPKPAATPAPENKLNYGLIVKDDFVKERENQLGNFEWSPDSKKLLFSQGGDLYVLTIGEPKPKRYTKTQSSEVAARFLDNDRILYQQNGNLFVLNTSDATIVQLTKEAKPEAFISVTGATPNKAGTMIAYIVSDGSKQKALFVPNYLDEFVQAPTVRRGWSEQKVLVVPADGSRDTPAEIKLPKSEGVSNFRRMAWAADGRSLIIDRNDKDTKRRQLFYFFHAGSKDEQQIVISDETDDKWQAPLSAIFEPNPKDASQLFFCSEKDGYNHIYLATLEKRAAEPNPTGVIRQENPTDAGYTGKVDVKQLTKGNWQVEWAKWTSDDRIIFLSTQGDTAERQFYQVFPANSLIINKISNEKGMKLNPQLEDVGGKSLTYIFERSTWNGPDEIFAADSCNVKCEMRAPRQLTKNRP